VIPVARAPQRGGDVEEVAAAEATVAARGVPRHHPCRATPARGPGGHRRQRPEVAGLASISTQGGWRPAVTEAVGSMLGFQNRGRRAPQPSHWRGAWGNLGGEFGGGTGGGWSRPATGQQTAAAESPGQGRVRVRRRRRGMRGGVGLGPTCSGRVGQLGQKKGFGLLNCLRPAQLELNGSFYFPW
jgi:hypothetical protein